MNRLRFGRFEFNPETRELRRDGRHVPIQDLPLRALEILLETPRHLVPRSVLQARLWPDDHSGLLDDNLNTTLRKLRQALRDDPAEPRYIETVPKRGYRLLTPVEAVEDDTAAPTQGTAGNAAQEGQRRVPLLALLAIAVTLVVAFLAWPTREPAAENPAGDAAAANEAAGARSLAVLPFINASGNPEDEYFSLGLTDEIIYRLGREPGIQVVSQLSSRAINTDELGARDTGARLGADVLVEGTVRRSDDRLRIGIQLVDASSEKVLWSQGFDRHSQDIFNLQQDIANTIATTLAGAASAASRGPTQKQLSATDPEAYDNYLQGRFHWHRRTRGGLFTAVDYLERSTEQAPQYAPAWAGLADALAVLGFYDYLPPAEAFPRAREAANRALAIDPDDASAHATLGYVALYYDWNFDSAENHFMDAIERQPGHSKAHQWYANLLTAAGRFDEADREMRLAQQLDPLSLIANAALGWVQYFAGRHDDALHQLALTLELSPSFELAYLWRGWIFEETGEPEAAVDAVSTAHEMSPDSAIIAASLARAEALAGDRDSATARLAALESSGGYIPAYEVAKAWLALGDAQAALDWLERALEERSHSMVFIRVDPQLRDARQWPGFESIKTRVFGQPPSSP